MPLSERAAAAYATPPRDVSREEPAERDITRLACRESCGCRPGELLAGVTDLSSARHLRS